MVSGRRTVEGILFISYRNGILSYTRVSEDGTIRLDNSRYHEGTTVQVAGHGWIMSEGERKRAKRFRTDANAVKAALKLKADKADNG
jgi:hypothetical protein